MDNAFDYSNPANGREFFGRKADIRTLSNLISNGENIALFCPPKSGRHSLIQQTLLECKSSGNSLSAVVVKLQDIRTIQDFLIRLGDSILKTYGSTRQEYASMVANYLGGSHFVFDESQFAVGGPTLSLNWDIDDEDTAAMLKFPFLLSADKGNKMLLILDEFQSLDSTEDSYHLFKTMEGILKEASSSNSSCIVFMTGSEYNAMDDIFNRRKVFFRLVQVYHPSPFNEKEIIDHIHRGLMSSGKVVDNELLLGVCKLFRNNIWYINHFMAICDHLSKGYIMEPILKQALNMMISLHETRFRTATSDLTGFQLQYLKAILDGHTRFSSVEVISKYGLHSSANVKRVREALIKKEIITFNEKDDPEFLDPLFEYWIKKYFFLPLQT